MIGGIGKIKKREGKGELWADEHIQILLGEIERLKGEMRGMVKFIKRDITKIGWTSTR